MLAATAYVGTVDPGQPGHYPLCPLKAATGLDCPFCGGLRATHALVHGDVAGAVSHNALVTLVLIPAMVVLWVLWVRREWLGRPVVRRTPPRVLVWSTIVLVVAFTVVRNIEAVPAFAWLGSTAG
jgi:hypothetical protein